MEFIEAEKICPIHEVVDSEKFENLKNSMQKDGWIGRAIPVIYGSTLNTYYALSGSHRIASAVATDTQVPCLVLDLADWEDTDNHDVLDKFDEVLRIGTFVNSGGLDDDDRLNLLVDMHSIDLVPNDFLELIKSEVKENNK